jgi:DnaJ-class molecular chaperone
MSGACPDCKGSGKYVGLQIVEPCTLCNGSGKSRGRSALLDALSVGVESINSVRAADEAYIDYVYGVGTNIGRNLGIPAGIIGTTTKPQPKQTP